MRMVMGQRREEVEVEAGRSEGVGEFSIVRDGSLFVASGSSAKGIGVAVVVGLATMGRGLAATVAVGMGVGEARGAGRSVEPPADWGTGRAPTMTC